MAYDPITGKYTPDPMVENAPYNPLSGMRAAAPATTTSNVAYRPESGTTIPGYTSISSYVNQAVAAMPSDVAGRFIGWEYSDDKKRRRAKYSDGKGGFTFGPWEENPDFKEDDTSKEDKDAFALLKDLFASYGLDELYPVIEGYMKSGMGPSEAKVKLKTEKAYIERFKGNEIRRSKGLNVLSEADYLEIENSYSETLKAYGLQNYFGSSATTQDRKNRNLRMADVIGNDVSAVEFKDRVSTAVDRVANADTFTKNAFRQFYNIGETELVSYFLDPQKALVNLKEKAAAAEIGGAALGQQLTTSMTSAEDLARFGISREQAQVGYANIAEILPTAGKLSQIYAQEGITYGQAEAEAETFKGLASEQRKRQRLIARETGAFGGASGITKGSLSKGAGGAI